MVLLKVDGSTSAFIVESVSWKQILIIDLNCYQINNLEIIFFQFSWNFHLRLPSRSHPCGNLIKLFSSLVTSQQNKLECLSLVECLSVNPGAYPLKGGGGCLKNVK